MRYADTFCKYIEEFTENGTFYVYTGLCLMTKVKYSVKIPSHELFAYRQGANIQDAMRSVSADDREFLMSGISPAGFAELFNGSEY